ncbi:universal stress protein [Kitasatospora sp. NPDC006697]|uniref:universal stress protein n=1 Tax=Kitasatospora sp. NPDC006697 TaxID=3364020 RepID=UPI0036B4F46B
MTRHPVLAAVDTSARSRMAALWAAEEAARRGAPLRLVHAWPFPVSDPEHPRDADLRHGAQAMLDEAVAMVRKAEPTVEVTGALVLDVAVDGLLVAAGGEAGAEVGAEVGAELLVLGTRGLGGFHGLLVGSVSLAVASRAELPVVLVREEPPTDPAELVVGLDVGEPAPAVLEFAFTQAASMGLPLRVVHGWELPPMYGYAGWLPSEEEHHELGSAAAKLVAEAVAPWREQHPEVQVIPDVRAGGGAGALMLAAEHAALLVVGRRTRAHQFGARLGSVAHAVIHHAPAPVAVVPHD